MIRAISLSLLLSSPAEAAELLMFESHSCPFCDKWNKELGSVYALTPEGKRAPLRRIDDDLPWPDDIKGVRPVRYTPTFVLVEEGAEVGRITGYNSEDFFWGLLGELIEDLPE